MTRVVWLYRQFAVVVALLLIVSIQAQAIPPIILHEFTFDDDSTLGVTGGFAGINDVFGIDGTFGIAVGYEQVFEPGSVPALVPFIRFASVDAVLTGPPGALGGPGWLAGSDLDSLLNLTGLEGSFAGGFDSRALVFTGVDGQGQPMAVNVFGADGQLQLKGRNNAGCCDFFNYQLDALADLPMPGDITRDGYVGIEDLNAVLGAFGQASMPLMGPDTNWDGYVGIEDLNDVLGHWNSGSVGTAPTAIPEPVALVVLVTALLSVSSRRR